MALSILAVQAFDLVDEGVAVTGDVPTGLFSIGLPGVGWSEAGALVAGALSVVFVGYSESLASARAMALKHRYEIDPDQELIAQGMACGAAGFVGGFATDGSLSKTSVADLAGQKTQMASLVNAVFVLLTMLFLASLFENLPAATLGAVVIDAMLGMVTFGPMRRYFRVNRADWLFFMAAMFGILFVDIIHGILIGVVLSLLLLIARASKPGVRRLGRDPKADVYVEVDRYSGLELVPGVVAVRMGGPLFFADANRFRDALNEMIQQQPGAGEGAGGGCDRDLPDRHRRGRHRDPDRRRPPLPRDRTGLRPPGAVRPRPVDAGRRDRRDRPRSRLRNRPSRSPGTRRHSRRDRRDDLSAMMGGDRRCPRTPVRLPILRPSVGYVFARFLYHRITGPVALAPRPRRVVAASPFAGADPGDGGRRYR